MTFNDKMENILGVNIRVRHSEHDDENYAPFKNPIIHKRINGSVIVPLNTTKLWGK